MTLNLPPRVGERRKAPFVILNVEEGMDSYLFSLRKP